MKKGLLIGMLLLLSARHSNAQLSQSETNSSSGTFSQSSGGGSIKGIYSANLYTGSVDVNIPIYSYKVDGLDLGVSLGYNTSGIRVDEISSNVGLGWNINTGGMITRKVNGIEDEINYARIDSTDPIAPYHNNVAVAEQRGYWVQEPDPFLYASGLIPQQEKEPDIFTANLGGRTITFAMTDYIGTDASPDRYTYTFYVGARKDIKIDLFLGDRSAYCNLDAPSTSSTPVASNKLPTGIEQWTDYTILRFKITDEYGNQFFFDRGSYQVKAYSFKTFHITYNTGEDLYRVPTSWCIKKIITYTGAEVVYEYTDGEYGYPAYRNQRVEEKGSYNDAYGNLVPGGLNVINDLVWLTHKFKKLAKITYPNGDVLDFAQDGNNRLDILGGSTVALGNQALTCITLSNGYGLLRNSYRYFLNYAYFNSDISGSPELPYPSGGSYTNPLYNLRLKLKSISKIGTDNITSELLYKFDYNNPLPPRLSIETDCYGFYNGANTIYNAISPTTTANLAIAAQLGQLNIPIHSNGFLTPTGPVSCTYGRDKSPNWMLAKRALLYKVTNGLGGNIEFTYQDHNLGNPPEFNSTATNSGYYRASQLASINGPSNFSPDPQLEYKNANDGICIDKIIIKDGYNADNTVTEKYIFSNGIRFFVGGYSWYGTLFSGYKFNTFPNDRDVVVHNKIYQSSFVGANDFVNGCNHGYSTVDVVSEGVGSTFLNHTQTTFTNLIAGVNETVNGVSHTGESRLVLNFGKFYHLAPYKYFKKHYLGLVKSSSKYSGSSSTSGLLSEVLYTYDEHAFSDSFYSSNIISYMTTSGGSSIMNEYTTTNSIVNLKEVISRNYSGAAYMESKKQYVYTGPQDILWKEITTNSKGQTLTSENIYQNMTFHQTYGTYTTSPLTRTFSLRYLVGKKTMLGSDVISYSGLGIVSSSNTNYYDGLGNTYSTSSTYQRGIIVDGPMGAIHFDKVYSLFSKVPITSSTIPTVTAKHFRLYDDHNNVLETGYNNDTKISCAIWDTRIAEKIAEVSNASYADIAYSSFEGPFSALGVADYNKGNWNFDPANVVLGTPLSPAMTGKYYYQLSSSGSAGSSYFLATHIPVAGKKYLLSVWYKGTHPATPSVFSATFTDQITINGWTLTTAELTGDGTHHLAINCPSGTMQIDELRFLPIEANMETYTYEPLIGVTSHSDERNKITYFEYDAMGRVTITRDIEGNILSFQKHVVQGSDY